MLRSRGSTFHPKTPTTAVYYGRRGIFCLCHFDLFHGASMLFQFYNLVLLNPNYHWETTFLPQHQLFRIPTPWVCSTGCNQLSGHLKCDFGSAICTSLEPSGPDRRETLSGADDTSPNPTDNGVAMRRLNPDSFERTIPCCDKIFCIPTRWGCPRGLAMLFALKKIGGGIYEELFKC